jgi:DNA-binding LytR/AlgR family response regulator
MKHTEDMLPPDKFIRIHRSFIVNTNYISRIERYGEHQIVLLNSEKIKISAARYHSLKQILGF